MARVKVVGDCWEWQAAMWDGYGVFNHKGKRQKAHRAAYELFVGPLDDRFVCHRCDNPKCVNPKHLFLGTPQDNMDDKVSKGRAKGYQKIPKATQNTIVDLRVSGLSQQQIADQIGISQVRVSQILIDRGMRTR